LRQVIARRRFRSKQEHARNAVSLWVFTNIFVQRQNVQQIEMLTFVLVQTLNLNIENRLRVDVDAGTHFYEFGQANLVSLFDIAPGLTEFRVVSVLLKVD